MKQGVLILTDVEEVSAQDVIRVDWAVNHYSTQELLEKYMFGKDWRVSYAQILDSDIVRTADKAEADRLAAEQQARRQAIVFWGKLRSHVVAKAGRDGVPAEMTDDEILAFVCERLAEGASDQRT